jgi:tRNA1(Val) A37 N6-methylase TrmN6
VAVSGNQGAVGTKSLDHADNVRRSVAPTIDRKRRSELGQFMTPSTVARFMASLLKKGSKRSARLLDAGAGVGSLTSAFLDRCVEGELRFRKVEIVAYELDEALHEHLLERLADHKGRLALTSEVRGGDFIEQAVNAIQFRLDTKYTHAILNPPYKKINTGSHHRLLLHEVGIETVNLYTAFVALALAMMEKGGQIVAIIPRSFCNGPYYRPFREFVLERAAIRYMHLFAARNKAFKDDEVLQENIIIVLERGGVQGPVTVSTSTDDSFTDLVVHKHSFDRIVFPADKERFVHVPTSPERGALELSRSVRHSLADLGIAVSTGPVVEFRLRHHLRDQPEAGCVPLLYPSHFSGQNTEWPKEGLRDPNAIMRNKETEKWLYPVGFYTIVRRFSSKEERRRVVASVVSPDTFPEADAIGFENHLNVLHEHKRGLSEDLARGLSLYLNSTAVDQSFRRFSGHTQVNATDLRLIKYPSKDNLASLGRWAKSQPDLTQELIDQRLTRLDE